jgi:alkaline phosphatase D
MGSAQRGWLLDGMAASGTRWNILAQQVMMAECRDGQDRLDMDKWDGYTADRRRVLEAAGRVPGTIVITGDIHFNYASDLPLDFSRPDAPAVAVELIGTSVTSGGNGSDSTPLLEQQLTGNPYLRFANAQRGYVRCELTRTTMRADYRVVTAISTTEAQISTRASYVSERDHPGLTT